VTDIDAGNGNTFEVSVHVSDGFLTLTNAIGVTSVGTGTVADPLRLTGTLADINSTLAIGLVYNPLVNFRGTTILTMTSNDRGLTGAGGPLTDTDYLPITILASESPPQVVDVIVDSSAWSTAFRNFVDDGFADPAAEGYRIPRGPSQLVSLPWVNIDQIKVVFSKNITSPLSTANFRLDSVSEYVALGRPVSTIPTIQNVTYDAATFTATLQLSKFIPASVLHLTVLSSGVTDQLTQALDGEWQNAITLADSGNGVAGGDFEFQLFVLPGDARDESLGNGTRTVNANDAQDVRDFQNGFALPAFGSIKYSQRADLNGDSFINAHDAQFVRDQQNAVIFRTVGMNRRRANATMVVGDVNDPLDLDGNGVVTQEDALLPLAVVNQQAAVLDSKSMATFFDVSGDGLVSPLDVLLVLNEVNLNAVPLVSPSAVGQETAPQIAIPGEDGTEESSDLQRLFNNSAFSPQAGSVDALLAVDDERANWCAGEVSDDEPLERIAANLVRIDESVAEEDWTIRRSSRRLAMLWDDLVESDSNEQWLVSTDVDERVDYGDAIVTLLARERANRRGAFS
jgi:hypothetical protein